MSIGSASEIIRLTHEGKGFSIADVLTITDAGMFVFLGIPDAEIVHFHDMLIDASAGPVLLELIENPTVSNTGTPATAFNRNRNSLNKHRMKIYAGATISDGTILFKKRLHGTSAGNNANAGEGLIRGEWDLGIGKTYAIRLTNQTNPGATVQISVDMHFYEDDI